METVSVPVPKSLYDQVVQRAATRNQAPARLVEEILREELMPHHPYVEVIDSRSGPRPVIKGTRIGIDVIVGYSQAGYAPRELVETILPQLTLAQIYDALSYYEDHRADVDRSLQANTPDVWRNALQQRLGNEAAGRLLGE